MMKNENNLRKIVGDSALELKVITYQKEIPMLVAILYASLSDGTSIYYTFLVSHMKKIADGVDAYRFIHVVPDTHEVLTVFTLYRKDISTRISNFIKCPDCEEIHFQRTDTKLELVSKKYNTIKLTDPLTLSLDCISQHESLALGATVKKIPKEDLYDN